jgi:hypothetical protein
LCLYVYVSEEKFLDLILKYGTIICLQKVRRKCYITSSVIYMKKCLGGRSTFPGAWLHPSGEIVIFLLGVYFIFLERGAWGVGRGAWEGRQFLTQKEILLT